MSPVTLPSNPTTDTSSALIPHLPQKTATTLEVRRWIFANFILRGVFPHQVPWIEKRVLWNGADLRSCTLWRATEALKEWGCEGAAAELIARDVVEGVKICDGAHATWMSRVRQIVRGFALVIGFFVLFAMVVGTVGATCEMIGRFVEDCERCQREKNTRPAGGYIYGYYGGSDV